MLTPELCQDRLHGLGVAWLVDQVAALPHPFLGLVQDHLDPRQLLGPPFHVDGDAIGAEDVGDDAGAELDVMGQGAETPDHVRKPIAVNAAPDLMGGLEDALDQAVELPEQVPGRQRVTGGVAEVFLRDLSNGLAEIPAEAGANIAAFGVLEILG